MLRFIEQCLTAWAMTARRGGVFLVAILVLAGAGAGYYAATHLKVNTDTSQMIDPALPFQMRAAAAREAFPQTKNDIIVIIRGPTIDETHAYAGALRERIAARSDAFSASFAPAHEPFFQQNGLLYLSVAELESRLTQMSKAAGLIETLIKSPNVGTFFTTLADNDELAQNSDLGAETLGDIYTELGEVVAASLDERTRPFSWMGAINPDGDEAVHTQLLYATPVLDFTRLQPAKAGIEVLREETTLLDEKFSGRVETYVTGDPALRVEELESVTTGIGLSFALSFIVVTFLLLVAYRSAAAAAITLTSLVITLTLTSAVAAAFLGPLNLVSVAFTVLLVGLGLDFSIHLFLHVQERRADGQSNREALKGALHEVGPALAMAAPTTSLAFFSFVPTAFNGIAQLGVIAGIGVFIAFLVSVTFLPAALALMPPSSARKGSGAVRGAFDFIERHARAISVLTFVLGAAALILLPQVRFDADQMALRNQNAPSVAGFNLLFENDDTAPYRLTRLAGSAEEAMETANRAKALETVSDTRSLPDFVPQDQDDKLELIDFGAGTLVFALDATPASVEGPPAREGLEKLKAQLEQNDPNTPGAVLARLLGQIDPNDAKLIRDLETNIFAYWPQLVAQLRSQLAPDYVELDSLPTSLRERYLSNSGVWRVDILPAEDVRDPKALDRFVEDVAAIIPDLAGGAYQSKRAGEIISEAMLQATLIALAVIATLLFLLTRRVRTVVLIIFPLVLAAILTAATGVLLDIPFNYANVIVLPLLIGIGVDSGIHLVLRHDQVAAGEGVYGTSTPRAVLFSALTTVASFGSLMLSPHRGTASMGELLSIAIAFTLICTLIVLPAVFRFQEERVERAARNLPKT